MLTILLIKINPFCSGTSDFLYKKVPVTKIRVRKKFYKKMLSRTWNRISTCLEKSASVKKGPICNIACPICNIAYPICNIAGPIRNIACPIVIGIQISNAHSLQEKRPPFNRKIR